MTYTPQTSFANHQALNPTRALPGAALDVELASIAENIATLLLYVEDIRRADANLQNAKVTWDALTKEIKDAIRPPGGAPILDDVTESVFLTGILFPDISADALASQVEAEAGVANDRLVTPLRVAQAIAALRAFASQSQAQAATAEDVVLSPARAKDLLNALRAFASQAEAEAGTAANRVMSPLGTAQFIAAKRPAFSASVATTWGAIAAGASVAQSITVTGAAVGDRVAVGWPASGPAAGLVDTAWVSAANTVTLRLTNVTGASITPWAGAATTLTLSATRF